MIDFTAKLFGLTVKEAAMKLAVDFGVSYDARGHDPPVKKPVKLKIRDELWQRQAEQRCFRVYAGYLHLLEARKDRYAPKPEDTDWHPLFVEALQKYSHTEYLLDTLLTGTEAEKAAVVPGTWKEVAALERRVSGFKARDQQNECKRGDGSRELAG